MEKLRRCTKCILPETFPGIEFNKDGICNYCLNYKKYIVKGESVLKRELSEYKNKGDRADCIVTTSGGRDSSFVLYKLVKDFRMKVLAVTYDWGMMTLEAHRNWEKTSKILSIEHIVIRPDTEKIKRHIRKNIKAWLKKPHLGLVWLFTQGDKQAEYHINKIAKKFRIPLVVTGAGNALETTHFKHAFMGVKNADVKGVGMDLSFHGKIQLLFSYALEYFKNPRYVNGSMIEMLRSFFIQYISASPGGTKWLHFFQYHKWDEDEVLPLIRKELVWESPEDTILSWRTDDATAPFYNYLHYMMAGFTENDTFRSNQIREGVLNREEALKIVNEENKPRIEKIRDYLKLLDLSFEDIKDLPELWKK